MMTIFLAATVVALLVILIATWRFPRALLRLLIRLGRRVLGFRRYTLTVDGVDWVYIDTGDRAGSNKPILLLVHGFGADKDMWLGYSALLRKKYRIVAPDLPGFGETTFDQLADFAPRAQAARLQRFCDAADLDAVHVAGSSMGGYVCCWLAVDAPSRLLSMTLMNAAGVLGEKASPVQEAAEAGQNPLVVENEEELAALLDLLAYKLPFIPRFVKQGLLVDYRERLSLFDRIFWQLVEASLTDGLAYQLERIETPTLIVWGREDRIIDVSCVDIFEHFIAGSRRVVFDRVGHVPMFEVPKETAAAHDEWMRNA